MWKCRRPDRSILNPPLLSIASVKLIRCLKVTQHPARMLRCFCASKNNNKHPAVSTVNVRKKRKEIIWKKEEKREVSDLKYNMKFKGKEENLKISLFYKKETVVKLLENRAITAAKVATFNDSGKVSGCYFATIW